jgi:toxin FitB
LSYLIDTNVLSELRRKQPDPNVVAWIQARPRQSLFLSVLTLGEIRKGLERLEDTARKQSLLDWLEVELPNYFLSRVLAVDAHTADRWGRLMAEAGRPLPAIDGLLAATALQHDLTLVTRNIKDFSGLEIRLLNPWGQH